MVYIVFLTMMIGISCLVPAFRGVPPEPYSIHQTPFCPCVSPVALLEGTDLCRGATRACRFTRRGDQSPSLACCSFHSTRLIPKRLFSTEVFRQKDGSLDDAKRAVLLKNKELIRKVESTIAACEKEIEDLDKKSDTEKTFSDLAKATKAALAFLISNWRKHLA